MSNLQARRLFSHVSYEYRYFAVASYFWNHFGPHGDEDDQERINLMAPGIGAIIQDSLLLHARQLIEFYLPKNSYPTDITYLDFELNELSPDLSKRLESFRVPIEVQVGHLTSWRDIKFRNKERETVIGSKRQRPNWNVENSVIIDLIFRALSESAQNQTPWSVAFMELQTAAKAVLKDAKANWPSHLSHTANVEKYARSLGL